MITWEINPIRLPLKYTWKISRNSSSFKINYLIGCNFRNWKGIGECAPNIRYGETPEEIDSGFQAFIAAGGDRVNDLQELTELLDALHLKNALRFGIESAYIHMICHADRMSVHDFLGVTAPKQVATSYTIPIMEPGAIKTFYDANRLERFEVIKIKANMETGIEALRTFSGFSSQPVIIDPNEAFSNADDVLRFMHDLKPYRVILMEQPMPATCVDDYIRVKQEGLYPLMADESICDGADYELLARQFDYVNMKLMKAGGYLNGLEILNQARQHGMKTMIGCMIETSLGISSAFHLSNGINFADLDGFLIVEDEPFGLLREENGLISLSHAG